MSGASLAPEKDGRLLLKEVQKYYVLLHHQVCWFRSEKLLNSHNTKGGQVVWKNEKNLLL